MRKLAYPLTVVGGALVVGPSRTLDASIVTDGIDAAIATLATGQQVFLTASPASAKDINTIRAHFKAPAVPT